MIRKREEVWQRRLDSPRDAENRTRDFARQTDRHRRAETTRRCDRKNDTLLTSTLDFYGRNYNFVLHSSYIFRRKRGSACINSYKKQSVTQNIRDKRAQILQIATKNNIILSRTVRTAQTKKRRPGHKPSRRHLRQH